MRVLAIVSLVLLTGFYVLVAGFGLVMSAFCFDAGTSPEAWSCFLGINGIAIGIPVVALIVGVVLLIRRRPIGAIIAGAIPAALVAVGYALMFITSMSYMPR